MLGLQLIGAASADGGAVNPTATTSAATAAPARTAPLSAEQARTNHRKGAPSPLELGQVEASAGSDQRQAPGTGTMRKGGAERAPGCVDALRSGRLWRPAVIYRPSRLGEPSRDWTMFSSPVVCPMGSAEVLSRFATPHSRLPSSKPEPDWASMLRIT